MTRHRTKGLALCLGLVLFLSAYFFRWRAKVAEDMNQPSVDMEGVILDFLEMGTDRNRSPYNVLYTSQVRQGKSRREKPPGYESTGDAAGSGAPRATVAVGLEKPAQKDLQETQTLQPMAESSPLGDEQKEPDKWQSERNSPIGMKPHQFQLESTVPVFTDPLVRAGFTLPVPFATLPVEQLLEQTWILELRQVLQQLPPGLAPISIVTADYKFRDVLLNWLIASKTQANPPLTHVIVISLDQPLCELLKRRKINCIFVAPSDYLTPAAIASLSRHVVFSEVMVLRLTVMRLINHWGYDVANYDTDAIVIKSPEPLYLRHADSHMIGSYGHQPGELSRVWGTTVCFGAFMTRSSNYTEVFWNTMSRLLPKSMNDQARLNYAISALQPDWGETNSKSILTDEWVAITPSGFKVTVLPARYICRQGCSRRRKPEYYVWHKGGDNSDGKINVAQRGRLWFLRKDWEARAVNSSTSGVEWLKEITEPFFI